MFATEPAALLGGQLQTMLMRSLGLLWFHCKVDVPKEFSTENQTP